MTEVGASGPLPIVMVGGGATSLIGPVHRAALVRNGAFELAGGLFSSDADQSIAFGASIGLDQAECRGPVAPGRHSNFECATVPAAGKRRYQSGAARKKARHSFVRLATVS
jgi:hypothetical protein